MMNNIAEYEKRSYEELSSEFQRLYPSVVRAFELIPLMYNRLTLSYKLSHKEAITKIYNDHHHLTGFTERNIRRYLPPDNPNLRKRVRTSRPKNSNSEPNDASILSSTEHKGKPSVNTGDPSHYNGTASVSKYELKEGLHEKSIAGYQVDDEAKYQDFYLKYQDLGIKASVLSCENDELRKVLRRQNAKVRGDEATANQLEFTIPKEKFETVKGAMENSRNRIYLTFDRNSGMLESVESDLSGKK